VGHGQIVVCEVSLTSLVSEILLDLQSDTQSRQIEWRVAPLPLVESDLGLMKQALIKLLSNAVKYTRQRSSAVIEVGWSLIDGQPTFFVRDNGVGFDPKNSEKLFTPFQRLHDDKDFEGSGVGLATVQRIIHKLGGQVWASSEPGLGSTFYFTPAEGVPKRAKALMASPASDSPPTILAAKVTPRPTRTIRLVSPPNRPCLRQNQGKLRNVPFVHACGGEMPYRWPILLTLALVFSFSRAPQEVHIHNPPEKLGAVAFPVSCAPSVQQQFNRGVALLHSFAYRPAEAAFRKVLEQDPRCAIAHWGIAMTHFYQLWDPPLPPGAADAGQHEIKQALATGANSERERAFISALNMIYQDAATPYRTRALNYERAMSEVAANNRSDVEAQVFYALALLANASPSDKTHAGQKQAADLLEPLDRAYPQHPGIPHYLIHACDNAELAPRGLAAARAYSSIAPSAPHALHMPSHIFTRLGLWDDSIASNLAARDAAHQQRDLGEELHAMDYLVYAYLQVGRDADAAQVIRGLADVAKLQADDFKVGYASTAMPIRYAVERGQWTEAAKTIAPVSAPPHIVAIAVWARGLGLARTGNPAAAAPEIAKLRQLQDQLRQSSNDYWASQVQILSKEVQAWSAQAQGKFSEAIDLLRQAADDEDAIEKLPVTPGPMLPAREQLGYLLLDQNQPALASKEFATALVNSPGRRNALLGAARAANVAANH
jgi:hypothetical protein